MTENENIEINESSLLMYINNELSEAQRIQVDKWLLSSTDNLTYFNELKKSWELSGQLKSAPVVVNTDDAWKKVLSEIKGEPEVIQLNPPKTSRKRIWWNVAAALLITIGIYSVLKMNTGDPGVILTEQRDTISSSGSVVVDTLEDGSIITLNENSMLSYDQSFGEKERRVEFKGEAFFDIERDEEKPFIIEMEQELHVKVLGTSFNIESLPKDSLVEVYVKTGKVEFGTNEETIILVAGEKGIYRKSDGLLTKELDELGEMKSTYWMNESLEFDGTPLIDVIGVLNVVFDDQVVLLCEEINEVALVSEHQGEELEYILEVISELFQLSLRKTEDVERTVYYLECNEG